MNQRNRYSLQLQARLLVSAVLVALTLSSCGGSQASGLTSTALPTRARAAQLGPTSTATAESERQPTRNPTPTLEPIPTPQTAEILAGPQEATVSLLVYSDFDCNLCAQAYQELSAILENYPDRVNYIFRPYPLLGAHEKSAQAAAAFYAARQMGKAQSMHDLLFEQRSIWQDMKPTDFRDWLLAAAADLGLEQDPFAATMSAPETLTQIENAFNNAQAAGVPGVPFLIINDQPYLLDWTRPNLEAAIRLALLEDEQFANPPPVTPANELPTRATLHFDIGQVDLQLFPSSAPKAISSFTFLARNGWYRETSLYLIHPDSLVMGGDPTNTGLGNAGYHFEVEIDPARRFNRAGIIALDNEGPATNSSRFLITLAPRPDLNGSYTIIGRVIDGLDLLQSLPPREPLQDLLEPPAAVLERISFDQ